MSDLTTRDGILCKANECVSGSREQDYGSPESNFETIAQLWNTYLCARPRESETRGTPLNARDVAAMLALLKIARIATGKAHIDNWVDLAGYAACGGEIEANGQT